MEQASTDSRLLRRTHPADRSRCRAGGNVIVLGLDPRNEGAGTKAEIREHVPAAAKTAVGWAFVTLGEDR